ncbi:MAG: riboflavin synthase [Candidatus Acidoferrales bacterium]
MFTGIIEEVGTVAELATPPLRQGSGQAGGTGRLRIEASRMLAKLEVGSSIAVSGCCLTVTEKAESSFICDLSPETLERTGFRRLQPRAQVNLEAPLTLSQPLGGHIVQGHVDGTGILVALTAAGLPADLSRATSREASAKAGLPADLSRATSREASAKAGLPPDLSRATSREASAKAGLPAEASAKAGDGNYWLEVEVPAELTRYLVEKGSVAVEGISLTVASIEGPRLRIAIIPSTYENTNLRTLQPGDPVNLECDLLAKYVEKLLSERPLATSAKKPASKLTLERLREQGF